MEAKVAVYNSHDEAVKAVEILIDKGFDEKSISLAGKADVKDDHIHIKSLEPIKDAPAFLGAGAGIVVGLLTGMGVFAIPGFGLLYGAGAVVGAIAGFDIGILVGGLGTILTSMGIKKDHVIKYQEHLENGRFLVIVHGSAEEVKRAHSLLG